jgi:hypothetical protein
VNWTVFAESCIKEVSFPFFKGIEQDFLLNLLHHTRPSQVPKVNQTVFLVALVAAICGLVGEFHDQGENV